MIGEVPCKEYHVFNMNLDHNDPEFTCQVWVYDHVNILHKLPTNNHTSHCANGGEELILE